jgi:ankyrin repeat protein
MSAVASQNAEVVKEILGYHTDINAATERSGFTALAFLLYRAPAQLDTSSIVKLLISPGADVNSRDSQEEMPVLYACQNQHPEAIRLLSAAKS